MVGGWGLIFLLPIDVRSLQAELGRLVRTLVLFCVFGQTRKYLLAGQTLNGLKTAHRGSPAGLGRVVFKRTTWNALPTAATLNRIEI